MRYLRAILEDLWAGLPPSRRQAKSDLAAQVRLLAERGEINLGQLTRALEASLISAKRSR